MGTGLKSLLPRISLVRLSQLRQRFLLLNLKKSVGKNTFIDNSVHILGWASIHIGHSTALSQDTWLNVNQRTPGHHHIFIGNNCFIGKRNFFSSGWQIYVADYCMTGANCQLMSGDHLHDDPMVPYIVSGVTNEKVIRLGVNTRLGTGVSIIGNVSIGHGSVIGAGSLVTRDIPPFSIAIGNPCRVVQRFDFSTNTWIKDDGSNSKVDVLMPDEPTYLSSLMAAYPTISMPLEASGRSFGDML